MNLLLNFCSNDAYPSQLQMLLGENYEVRNFGHNGATLLTKGHRPYVETQEYRDALNFKANILSDKLSLSLIHRNVFTKMETIENQLQ